MHVLEAVHVRVFCHTVVSPYKDLLVPAYHNSRGSMAAQKHASVS